MITVLALILLLAGPAFAVHRLAPIIDPRWSVGAIVILSGTAFGLYAHDKRRAKSDGWRVPEATLHLVEALGGWPGAFIAQRLVRHKNRKVSFQVCFWTIVALHQYLAIDFALGWALARGVARMFQ